MFHTCYCTTVDQISREIRSLCHCTRHYGSSSSSEDKMEEPMRIVGSRHTLKEEITVANKCIA